MKKLSIICAAIVASFQMYAAELTFNAAAAGITTLTGPVVLDKITLYSASATPTIVFLLDGTALPTATATTNYIVYPTNRIDTYITTLGTTNQMTNRVLFYAPNVIPAGTVVSSPLLTLVCPPNNQTVTYDMEELGRSLTFAKSLSLSNSLAGVSGVVTYRAQ